MDAPWEWYQRYNAEAPKRPSRSEQAKRRRTLNKQLGRQQVFARNDQRCVVPGCLDRHLTLDHIVPRSAGGSSCQDNLQPMCRPHNTMKASMSNEDFQRLLGLTW